MSDHDRHVTVDKGAGATPAMNRPGPEADADREDPAPGNRGWDQPAEEAPESIEGAVRAGADDPLSPGAAIASEGGGVDPETIPEPNEPA